MLLGASDIFIRPIRTGMNCHLRIHCDTKHECRGTRKTRRSNELARKFNNCHDEGCGIRCGPGVKGVADSFILVPEWPQRICCTIWRRMLVPVGPVETIEIRGNNVADSGARNSEFSRLGAGISGKRSRLLRCDGAIRRGLGFGEFQVMRQPRWDFRFQRKLGPTRAYRTAVQRTPKNLSRVKIRRSLPLLVLI